MLLFQQFMIFSLNMLVGCSSSHRENYDDITTSGMSKGNGRIVAMDYSCQSEFLEESQCRTGVFRQFFDCSCNKTKAIQTRTHCNNTQISLSESKELCSTGLVSSALLPLLGLAENLAKYDHVRLLSNSCNIEKIAVCHPLFKTIARGEIFELPSKGKRKGLTNLILHSINGSIYPVVNCTRNPEEAEYSCFSLTTDCLATAKGGCNEYYYTDLPIVLLYAVVLFAILSVFTVICVIYLCKICKRSRHYPIEPITNQAVHASLLPKVKPETIESVIF